MSNFSRVHCSVLCRGSHSSMISAETWRDCQAYCTYEVSSFDTKDELASIRLLPAEVLTKDVPRQVELTKRRTGKRLLGAVQRAVLECHIRLSSVSPTEF